jgi:ubiquinone/menaquinone biosynthesis C-methylase UbiE
MQFFNILSKHRFFDPSKILPYAEIPKGATVADFGCGNGFYPAAAGKIVGDAGQVYAVDVQNEALEATMSAAKQEGLKNIYTIRHDLEHPGLPIAENSCDAVILAGILHLSNVQRNVLRETYRVLKTGGKAIIIEWKKEQLPFGPNIKARISENEMNQLLTQNGFKRFSELPTDNFHYGLVYIK